MRRSYIAAHDGTERAADAVALARVLARPDCAPVRMVHVCRAGEPRAPILRVRAERARDGRRERLRLPGDPLPLNLTAHSVAHGLQEAAEREPAALVVDGLLARRRAGRTFPERLAQRLMQGAPCPVAIAPSGYAARRPTEIRVIGVAVDADPESWEALRHAIELARGFDAHVRVMTAVDPAAEASAWPCRSSSRVSARRPPRQDLLRDVRPGAGRRRRGDGLCEGRRVRRSSRRATRTSISSCADRAATGRSSRAARNHDRTSSPTRAALCS